MAADHEATARRAREVAARIQRELAEDLARARARFPAVTGAVAETIHPASSVRRAHPAPDADPPAAADGASEPPSRTEAA